ncbi:G-patch domain and KOW motifs-containing protein [Pimephales promelas]|uniref:G-patch domain and KOW motifs-containing protein n=1 Tax=Pimephales promelas TaxID=90988 RepID=UPI00195562A3|nr:G-patch domain and KOW motifs-containing protein [Pimephales promelas]KAG1951003.1 G-patch domain and KOW motifs-containing protein [Pimephales promelas]
MASPEWQQERQSLKINIGQDDGGKKSAPISFGFSKTLSRPKPGKAEERDFLVEVEGKELKGTKPVEKPKELIIPLIHKNRWYRQDAERGEKSSDDKTKDPSREEQDTVESQAVKELIEESQKHQERWKNGPQSDPNLSIPILMQNQAPEGFEDGDKVNVDMRPESSTEADYELVPVEAYGLAMLKGMGWKQGEGIGRTFKQDVKPIEHQLRPKGLGLGADRSSIRDLEPGVPKRPPKPGDERGKEEEALVLGPGGCVQVVAGAHKDLYGKIEGVDPDNARVVVKLAIGGKTVTISQHSLKLVTRKEYDKYSKDLSRLSKVHKDKEREKEREQQREREQKLNGKDERGKTDRDRDREKDQKKRKHRESSADREKPPPAKESRPSPPAPSWLQRDLRVRFIDKAFKGGKYYNSKMRVEDVLTPHTCVCRTEDNRLLDDIRQKMLETIVPKNDSDFIMVVMGEHRGQVGRILKRDREKCRAMVQLDRYEEQLFTLDYDAICHYVGGTEH